jgi:diaminopimelate epimerase
VAGALEFVKMSGTGNDFVLVDNRGGAVPEPRKSRLARRVCRRRTGVGGDGLVLLERSETADLRMRIFNADGSEPEMCGNGSRCLAAFARSVGAAGPEMTIETKAGPIRAEIVEPGGRASRVRVELTPPGEVSSRGQLDFAGERREVFSANTGVPHAVVFVDDLDAVDVPSQGRALRFHEAWGEAGANADFVLVEGERRIALRTYERGVEDETLACGTGAVAAALVAAWRGGWPSPVEARVRSGEVLAVHFAGGGPRFEGASLEGAVAVVYRGELDLGDGCRLLEEEGAT